VNPVPKLEEEEEEECTYSTNSIRATVAQSKGKVTESGYPA
jgi:hypothetical protein